MVKKTKPAPVESKADNQLAAAVKESAQQIWLAGLGAFAKAQQEGGKVFEALVSQGRDIQKRTRAMTEERITDVGGRVGKVAGGLSKQATESWDRLEQVFEERVARALSRLGVPTNTDIQSLIERVDALNASVQALGGKAARRATRKPAAKKAAVAPKATVKASAPAVARKMRAPRKSTRAAKAAAAE
jgi:poly(hydroxyalkanoate) granule-associated protein